MIQIFNENCFETMNRFLKQNKKVDIILTSPPYNTGKSGTSQSGRDNYQNRYDVYDESLTDDEYIDWSLELFKHYDSVLGENGVILYNISYGVEHPDLLWDLLFKLIHNSVFMIADCIVWKKDSALPANQNPNKMTRITEFVFVICRRTEFETFNSAKVPMGNNKYTCFSNFIQAKNNDGANELNKATFSTDFVEQLLIRYAKQGMIIYDSFMGTGTTAVACKRIGLDCYGSELSPAQCKLANEWLNGERFVKNKNVKKLF